MPPRRAAAPAPPPPPPPAPPPPRASAERSAGCRCQHPAWRGVLASSARAHLQPAREEAVLLCGGCLQLRARVLAAALEAAVGRDRAGGAHVLRRGAALQAPAARREAGRGARRGGASVRTFIGAAPAPPPPRSSPQSSQPPCRLPAPARPAAEPLALGAGATLEGGGATYGRPSASALIFSR